MNSTKIALLLMLASLPPVMGQAAEQPTTTAPKVQAEQQVPTAAEFDKQAAQVQENLQKLQSEMEKIQQTQDPQERQKLLQDHWNTMQQGMQMMGGMGMWGGGGMMGCCGGGGMMGGHMMGWSDYSDMTPAQRAQRQYMMDRYMGMQQMMMNHMMWHQQYMWPQR
ncbi:hypothetical protein [Pseudomonas delhiensis]|uniref:hypothetical protein n=1 Tax=Pseudomonas delhiensis TaxID=366289 RepID=UPI00315B3DC4